MYVYIVYMYVFMYVCLYLGNYILSLIESREALFRRKQISVAFASDEKDLLTVNDCGSL